MRFFYVLLALFGGTAIASEVEVSPSLVHRDLSSYEACGRNTKKMARVRVDHLVTKDQMNNPVHSSELKLLMEIFIARYNQLNHLSTDSKRCDRKARFLFGGQVKPMEFLETTRWVYQHKDANGDDIYLYRRTFMYEVYFTAITSSGGKRSESDEDFRLFDLGPDAGQTSRRLKMFTPTSRAGTGDDCSCAPEAEDLPPLEEQFEEDFKEDTKIFAAKGDLSTILLTEQVTELEVVDCDEPDVIEDFFMEIDLDTSKPMTKEEIDAMELNIPDAYNELESLYCDPCFRQIVEVTVTPESRRMLMEGRNLGKKRANVSGKCKRKKSAKCQQQVFNDGSRRVLLPLVQLNVSDRRRRRRRLQSGATCYCPTDPLGFSAPTEEAMTDLLDEYTSKTIDLHVNHLHETTK